MDEPFEIPVDYKSKELLFPAKLLQFGFTHRFLVDVYGQGIFYERGEEGNYRALISPEQISSNKKIDMELLKTIAEAIEAILR